MRRSALKSCFRVSTARGAGASWDKIAPKKDVIRGGRMRGGSGVRGGRFNRRVKKNQQSHQMAAKMNPPEANPLLVIRRTKRCQNPWT
jgi:hypothetical protein